MALKTRRTRKGPHISEGSRLLWLAMKERNMGNSEMERHIGLAHARVTALLFGDRRPQIPTILLLQEKLGIPPEAWVAKPKGPLNFPRPAN